MRILRNRLILLILSSVILMSTSACWSPVELNDRAFANLMLIDLTEDGQFELTLGFPLANRMIPGEVGGSGEKGQKPFAFVTKTGKSLPHALQDIQSDISRDITFGQTRNIVISQKLAKRGLDPLLDFISRHIAFHISANLFITPGKALEIVETPTTFERFISILLRSYVEDKETIDTTLRDILRTRYKSEDILVPLLAFGKQPEITAKLEKAETWLGVDGAAILKKGRMINPTLSKEDMKTSLWIDSNIKVMIINIESPTDGKEVSFNIENVKTKVQVKHKENVPSIHLQTRGTASILASDSKLDLKDDAQLIQLQKALNQEMRNRILRAINTTRTAQADVFHFKDYIDWKYPHVLQKISSDWNEFYAKELEIESTVNVRIRSTGEAYKSIKEEST
ncbi:Ger(x)C family spore germination protein [Paenibacillus lentus]|uniref:Ger(x)C family spore germination protein n=1 Tax=Paenibacillus lentus TaxID=1338368 RepID=UPI0013DE1907|nr:Ger(x)C family spore germination protein [Paenibacillus lentus]